jgi:hypothetical protein
MNYINHHVRISSYFIIGIEYRLCYLLLEVEWKIENNKRVGR